MTDVEERIRQLREEAARFQESKVRAQHDLAVAEARRDAALAALAEEFGVHDEEAADRLLEKTEDELAAECASAEASLAEAAGG